MDFHDTLALTLPSYCFIIFHISANKNPSRGSYLRGKNHVVKHLTRAAVFFAKAKTGDSEDGTRRGDTGMYCTKVVWRRDQSLAKNNL